MIVELIAAQNPSAIFGTVSPPPGVSNFGGTCGSGLIVFISNMIKVVVLIAGLFGTFNIISAGYLYLSSNGNAKVVEEAGQKLLMSFIGLAIIVGSFAITSIVSYLLFGDASFILNPDIPTATAVNCQPATGGTGGP